MAITPGQPIPTLNVHPFAALAGQGVQQFSVGARMASAKMAQDQAGFSSFLRDSMRAQIQRETQQLEKRKLEINTGLKLESLRISEENAAADRALRAQSQAASLELARAREGRASAEHAEKMRLARQKEERDALLQGTVMQFLGGSLNSALQSSEPESFETPPLPNGEPFNPEDPGAGLLLGGSLDPATISLGSSPVSNNPVLDSAIKVANVPSEAEAGLAKYRETLRGIAALNAANRNYSAVASNIKELAELDLKEAQAASNTPQRVAADIEQIFREEFDPSSYLPIDPNERGRRNEDELKSTFTGFRIADAPAGEFQLAMQPRALSKTALADVVSALDNKSKELVRQKGRAETRVRQRFSAGDATVMSDLFDDQIKDVDARFAKATGALADAYVNQAQSLKSPVDTRQLLDTVEKKVFETQNILHELGDDEKGEIGELVARRDGLRSVARQRARAKGKKLDEHGNPKLTDSEEEQVVEWNEEIGKLKRKRAASEGLLHELEKQSTGLQKELETLITGDSAQGANRAIRVPGLLDDTVGDFPVQPIRGIPGVPSGSPTKSALGFNGRHPDRRRQAVKSFKTPKGAVLKTKAEAEEAAVSRALRAFSDQ